MGLAWPATAGAVSTEKRGVAARRGSCPGRPHARGRRTRADRAGRAVLEPALPLLAGAPRRQSRARARDGADGADQGPLQARHLSRRVVTADLAMRLLPQRDPDAPAPAAHGAGAGRARRRRAAGGGIAVDGASRIPRPTCCGWRRLIWCTSLSTCCRRAMPRRSSGSTSTSFRSTRSRRGSESAAEGGRVAPHPRAQRVSRRLPPSDLRHRGRGRRLAAPETRTRGPTP